MKWYYLTIGALFLYTSVNGQDCSKYSYSACAGDQDAILLGLNTGSRDKCFQYATITDKCQFYRFSEEPIQGVQCALYMEPFGTYSSHCNIIGGPASDNLDLTCLDPSQDTCAVIQQGSCLQYGKVVEHFESLPTVEECAGLCAINPSCKYWQYMREEQSCNLLDSEDNSCQEIFGPKNKSPTECGQAQETTSAPVSTESPPPINCPADGLKTYPDDDDCASYWECFNGRLTHMTCQYCFLYNEGTGQCDQKENVQCGSRPQPGDCQEEPGPPPCIWPNGYFQDNFNCINYVVCEDKTPTYTTCRTQDENGVQKQLHYNPDAIQCDWDYRVDCKERPICRQDGTKCQCEGAEIVDKRCRVDGIEADPFDCRNYLFCDGGNVVEEYKCTPADGGEYYDGFGACTNNPADCGTRPMCTGSASTNCQCYVK